MSKLELLSPAGDMECLEAAVYFGADAVYIGGEMMQLRAASAGFSMEQTQRAVEFTHSEGVKLYVTVNSFAKNKEIPFVSDYAKTLYEIGVDAVIVSDIGVMAAIKKGAPDLSLHVSTQANCQNYSAAKVYYDLGAERIVLAREMSIEEIAELRSLVPKDLELEAFIHGAMCMSYSGRCMISSFLTNRSGNRGECTQPCRWQYHLVEQKRPNEFYPIEENDGVTSILSSHDLNCIDFIDKLIGAGITSFKIEGRMKTPYYVATVTNAYRRRLDNKTELDLLEKELNCVSHRPFSSGFYFGEMKYNHINDGLYHRDCQFIGVVLTAGNSERVLIEQRNSFKVGETLEIVSPYSLGESFEVKDIINSKGKQVDTAHLVKEKVSINCPYKLKKGDMLRRRIQNNDENGK